MLLIGAIILMTAFILGVGIVLCSKKLFFGDTRPRPEARHKGTIDEMKSQLSTARVESRDMHARADRLAELLEVRRGGRG